MRSHHSPPSRRQARRLTQDPDVNHSDISNCEEKGRLAIANRPFQLVCPDYC
jgi:hypothetical protein